MRQLLTMTAADLRQRVRDKSVLTFGIVVPLALMFVMNLVFGGAEEIELDSVTVAASVPADDDPARAQVRALPQIDGLHVPVEAAADDDVEPRSVRGGDA